MRFPKQELDIDQYLHVIDNLLKDEECHLFIDTNIISQLYKLNDDARSDFFNWVSTVEDRFHIPNWTVHEYQKRYCSQQTKDYLTELNNKEIVNKLKDLSNFVKGYVSDSLLVGSIYQGHKDQLFVDLDDIADKFEKIHAAINKKLSDHQLRVHSDILQNLQPYTMDTDIYSILKNIDFTGVIRYGHSVPPGFGDIDKKENRYGDLVIWNEILDFSKRNDIKKAIWITRDGKPDMAYTPQKQMSGGHVASEKLSVAHESLVYEFFFNTNSNEFYIVNFLAFVKIISSSYQNLAISFQIVTTPVSSSDADCEEQEPVEIDNTQINQQTQNEEHEQNLPDIIYSNASLAEAGFEENCRDPLAKKILEGLKSHNWYKQNDAAKLLMKWQPTVDPSTVYGRDIMFVLGRNIYQSADGTANDAIRFLQNLSAFIQNWDIREKTGFIDGMLYEVFFDSHGIIRPKNFKTKYFDYLLRQIDQLGLQNPYQYINSSLYSSRGTRFTPEVGTDKRYTFEFEFSEIDPYGLGKTSSIKIDGRDETETFKHSLSSIFAGCNDLKDKLSSYYAVPKEQIDIIGLGDDIEGVTYIGENVL